LRTSWIYGARGKNFLLTILRLAQERRRLTVVADQVGTPNWSRAIAAVTAQILAQCYSPRSTRAGFVENNSIYHLSASGQTSWYGLARAILEEPLSRGAPEVIPIASVDYPTPAGRPKNSVLANARIIDGFGLTIPHWHTDLQQCVREVLWMSANTRPRRHRFHAVKVH
jgi:dTDP-4-dehydrorhamnose reductase